jgi:hypothetical protein
MEEHTRRLRVFENRVIKGILGPKRDEVKGGWIKLHNEELHNSYSSPNIQVFVGKPEMKRSLGRSACKWEDNIKIGLREVGWGIYGLDWVETGGGLLSTR